MSSPATLAFDSILSLIGYTPVSSHETVQILGYYAPADGGGGEFYWDSASMATPDGGSVIASSVVLQGNWIRIFETLQISVKAFGAVGNNVANDYPAISSAANYCNTLVNSNPSTATLYFPPATGYLTNTTVIVKPFISVWMESALTLNDSTFSQICLQIGATLIPNINLNCRLMVHNKTNSTWGNFTNCIGIKFFNITASNIKLDNISGFTIGCQLYSDKFCAYNNFYVASITDNQRAFDFSTISPNGFVNENVFIGGNYGTTLLTSNSPWNTQNRWGVYGLTAGSMNQNVFYKPCFQLGAFSLLTSTSINSLNITAPGSYTNGAYPGIALTGGSGSGAVATITVSSGGVSSVVLTSYGINYEAGDALSATIPGGSGFAATVTALAINATGVQNFSFLVGSGYTNGTYTNVSLTGGTGTGAKATITVEGAKISKVQLTAMGIGYTVGDILSASSGFGMAINFLTVSTLIIVPTSISTFTFAAGSMYTNGSFTGVALTGGAGSGAKATITVSSGVISVVQITSSGIGYAINDTLSATSGFGTATNFLTVTTVFVSPTSVSAFTLTMPGSGYTMGIYSNVSLTGGTGSGAKATITVSSLGVITSVQLTAIGIGYAISDVLSASVASIGGTGSGFNITINTLSGGVLAVPVYLDGANNFSFNNCRVESCSNTIVQVRNTSSGNSLSIDYFNNSTIFETQLTIDDISLHRNTVVKFNWNPESEAANTLIYKSPLLINAVAPYGINSGGANLYNIKGLDWVKQTDGSVTNGSTITSIGPDYIELSSNDAYSPSITFNTVAAKRFLVKFDTVNLGATLSGYSGRIFINCYDASGIVIDPTTIGSLVIWSYNTAWATYGANTVMPSLRLIYGKGYTLLADINSNLIRQFYFNVDTSVAKVRLIFTPGTQNLKLRQFSVYSLDNKSESGYNSNAQTDDFIGLASTVPTIAYPQGTFVKNDFSSDTKSQFWYNTNGLSTGWKTSNDFNNLVNNPLYTGAGSPNLVVTAPVGSLYLNTSGGAGTTLYVKESGSGNAGWVGK